MKLFQKKQEPLATKKADGLKKRRIGSVMQAIEKMPPSASVSKISPTASTEATVEANTSTEAESAILEATLSGIDKLLLDMATEETVAAADRREKGLDDQPLVKELHEMDNVILTPHIAFFTNLAVKNMVDISLDDVMAILNGEKSPHEITL